jgi:hypothetical protein
MKARTDKTMAAMTTPINSWKFVENKKKDF